MQPGPARMSLSGTAGVYGLRPLEGPVSAGGLDFRDEGAATETEAEAGSSESDIEQVTDRSKSWRVMLCMCRGTLL